MVDYAGQDIKMEVEVIEDGWWALDRVSGKKLMAVSLKNKHHGLKYASYVPTTADIVKIVTVYLECENFNDGFKFKNGSTRPSELHRKIKELKDAIANYESIPMDVLF